MTWLASVLDEAARNRLRVLLFAHIPPTSYVNSEEFKRLINAAGCVKTMMVGHTHRNKRYLFGDVPVLERIYNTASPLGYSMIYPYPDGR
ncbi:hypothetical protein ACFL1R_10585, partial [Candidatus Latescibacterota bacterium]